MPKFSVTEAINDDDSYMHAGYSRQMGVSATLFIFLGLATKSFKLQIEFMYVESIRTYVATL